MPHSHHSHSGQFCSHADPQSSLRKVIQTADQLGFTHFGLSEHVPRESQSQLYPEEVEKGLDPHKLKEIFHDYLIEAKKLQVEYDERAGDGVKILVGIETENIKSKEEDSNGKPSRNLDYLIQVLQSIKIEKDEQSNIKLTIKEGVEEKRRVFPEEVGKGVIDYLVGSVHHVHDIPIDFDKPTLEKALSNFHSQEQEQEASSTTTSTNRRKNYHRLVSAYLDAQYEVFQRLRPETIGHLDLPFLFDPSNTWDETHLRNGDSSEKSPSDEEMISWGKLERNVRFACSYGALFEINGASFRKGWETAYPSTNPLKLILSLSGRVCLSDDSHGTAQVGLNYLRSRKYLLDNKVESIWYLERRAPKQGEGGPNGDTSYSEQREKLERERSEREKSDAPGKGAPIVFERGTVAIEMKDWEKGGFWEKLEERRRGV